MKFTTAPQTINHRGPGTRPPNALYTPGSGFTCHGIGAAQSPLAGGRKRLPVRFHQGQNRWFRGEIPRDDRALSTHLDIAPPKRGNIKVLPASYLVKASALP